MDTWLDTETKALLQKSPPKKLAPPDTAMFSLVLLSIYRHDIEREIRAIRRILQTSNVEARHLLGKPLPVRITEGLTHSDALLGQFELISCDSVSGRPGVEGPFAFHTMSSRQPGRPFWLLVAR